MEYIQQENNKKREGFTGTFRDTELSSDRMVGLVELLDDSYSFYSDYYEKEKFKKEYDNDECDWYADGVIVESVGDDLIKIRRIYQFGIHQNEEELELEKKQILIVPRKALIEFIKLYRCAEREEWTTRRIEFDGKDFRLWLDGKEYTIDQDKLDRLEIYHKYGR
ncbi:hypothetical protein HOM50_03075 [bacterium]|jgi:hypothetical protein|nr:hypothetical protein [bacterium]MBT5015358.1 hypothetical protein [bacterium]